VSRINILHRCIDMAVCLKQFFSLLSGRAVAQRLDAGFPPRRPGFACGQHVGFVLDKAALGQVFSEYFGFPCQFFPPISPLSLSPGADTIGH
jgi:hypothetical protein